MIWIDAAMYLPSWFTGARGNSNYDEVPAASVMERSSTTHTRFPTSGLGINADLCPLLLFSIPG